MSSDTVSFRYNGKGFRYEMCKLSNVILEHDLSPFSKLTRSKEFVGDKAVDEYVEVIERVGPIHPLVVFDHPQGFAYVGPLEQYYAYEKIAEKFLGELYIYVAVLPQSTPAEKIIEASVLLNPDKNIPNHLYRLWRLKALINLGLTDAQIQKFLKTGKANAAAATKVRRDLKICRNLILYECMTGISPGDGPLQLPLPEKAKLNYKLAILILEKLGDDKGLWEKFLLEMNQWIDKRGYELPTDENIPYHDREWYKKERDKPLKIALSLLDEEYAGRESGMYVSRFKPWDISVIDDMARILRVSSVELDLKNKSDDNIRLLLDMVYKMGRVSPTLHSYLMTISPVEHGGKIRGQASFDDKTIELRSNLPEFYSFDYARFLLRTKMIYYSDRKQTLHSLGLSFSSFGFKNSGDKQDLRSVRSAFCKWDKENSYKYKKKGQYFVDVEATLGRDVIYKRLRENVLQLNKLDNEVTSFEDFFLLIFVRSFREWQDEVDKSKKGTELIILNEKNKNFNKKVRKVSAKEKTKKQRSNSFQKARKPKGSKRNENVKKSLKKAMKQITKKSNSRSKPKPTLKKKTSKKIIKRPALSGKAKTGLKRNANQKTAKLVAKGATGKNTKQKNANKQRRKG